MEKFVIAQLATLLLLLSNPPIVNAQAELGSLTASAGTCQAVSTVSCVVLPLSGGQNAIIFNVTGTYSGTNSFEFSPDGQTTWRVLSVFDLVGLANVTSTTGTGTYTAVNPGYTHVRVRHSAHVSGTAVVLIRAISNNSVVGVNFGGAATVGTVTQGTAGVDPWLININTIPGPGTTTGEATSPCYHVSTASTNSINCKGSVANLFGFRAINTTSTLAYLRLYNLASAPTCSSATGFIESIPIPHNTGTGGGVISVLEVIPTNYTTGLGFCITGGGTSTDNTNAVAGVYLKISYK